MSKGVKWGAAGSCCNNWKLAKIKFGLCLGHKWGLIVCLVAVVVLRWGVCSVCVRIANVKNRQEVFDHQILINLFCCKNMCMFYCMIIWFIWENFEKKCCWVTTLLWSMWEVRTMGRAGLTNKKVLDLLQMEYIKQFSHTGNT